jgi:parallel beta-helix repeat protein
MFTSVGITLQTSNENIISGNKIFLNQGNGILLISSNQNVVTNNNINMNINGIRLDISEYNTISNNNFIGNLRNAFFWDCKGTKWSGNFWSRIRFFPKIITGAITVVEPGYQSPGKYLPWPNFDFRPAKRPLKIGG